MTTQQDHWVLAVGEIKTRPIRSTSTKLASFTPTLKNGKEWRCWQKFEYLLRVWWQKEDH